MATKALIAELHRRGFDLAKAVPFERAATIGCSQCQALAIDGIATHEHGCPNKPVECRECGEMIPRGEACNCLEPVED